MSRRIWDIPGGVHPPQNKSQSNQSPIQAGPIPKHVVLPIQQHIGSPAAPAVEVGDKVLKGQVIAEATGFVSAPVHASTSGTVVAIEPRAVQHPSQIDGLCVVIESDGNDQWIERQGVEDYAQLEKTQVLDLIRNAGITGMGGAGFPTAVKLSPPPDANIEQLILNAVECEPYITADDVIMRERAEEIVAGLSIIQWLVNPKETLIGIEDNKPEAIKAMQAATANTNIEVIVVPTKYPSGGEKQLIQILTGKEVPSGGLPANIGVVCQNVGTAYAINRAVNHGEPLVSRITTLTGDTIGKKGNYEVLLGTPVEALLDFGDTNFKKLDRLIMGGPMMGFAIHDLSVPVVKVTNCLLAPAKSELPDPRTEQACIRCGSCEQACPASLLPQQLYWFSKTQDFEKAEAHNLMDCIECGACAFVCPSNIPLVQYYRYAKRQVRVNSEQNAKSDHARERFEFRQARLEKEEQEKEAKRKARAEAAAKKQAAKKAGKAAPKAAPTGDADKAKADPLTALKSAAASATKRWKDAEKAYKTAEANGSDKLEALANKIEQLKTKADKANEAFVTARKAAKESAKEEAASDAPKAQVVANDPLAEIKKTSTEDFEALQAAKKALEEADQANADLVAELTAKVEAAKAKSDASKKAMKEARAKQREEIQKQKAAEDPVKAAQTAYDAAEKKLQKLEKSMAMLQEKGGDTSKLEGSLADAKAAFDTAKSNLESAKAATEKA
ncbi:MAG: electron transport complex subunit RsxC [Pseudomonadales bacterium]|nr:electron transport complex subunit RsxC [Pseudomonadales bacterium]